MRTKSRSRLEALAALIFFVVFSLPVHVSAVDEATEQRLSEIVLEIEDELRLAGAPEDAIARCSNAIQNLQATGLSREIFISNLVDELTAVVDDDAALQAGLAAVDDLVAEYQALAGEA